MTKKDKDKLLTVNRFNRPKFAQGVDRVNNNIFDGEFSSTIDKGWAPHLSTYSPLFVLPYQRSPISIANDYLDIYGIHPSLNAGTSVRPNPFVLDKTKISLNPGYTLPQEPDYSRPINTGDWSLSAAVPFGTVSVSDLHKPAISPEELRKIKVVPDLESAVEAVGPLTKDMIKGGTTPVKKPGFNWKAAAPAIGSGIGMIGNHVISDGFNTETGTAIANAGNMIGQAVGMANPILGGIISAGSGLLGGFWNRGFGVDVDKKKEAAVKSNIAAARNTGNELAQATDNQAVINAAGNMVSGVNTNVARNGLFNHKGDEINADYEKKQNSALAGQVQGLAMGADNADSIQGNNAQRYNTIAFGGPLDSLMYNNDNMGAIEYGFLSDYFTNKNKQADMKNKMPGITGMPNNMFALGGPEEEERPMTSEDIENIRFWLLNRDRRKSATENFLNGPLGVPEKVTAPLFTKPSWYHGEYIDDGPVVGVRKAVKSVKKAIDKIEKKAKRQGTKAYIPGTIPSMFALGGDVQTHGADFTTGLASIDAGGSHEENPYDGVQVGVDSQGTPNLVEEGETIFNDYVFSKRIELDDQAKERFHVSKKRDITYAEMSKKLERESSERPNDPISQAALKMQMEDLQEEQERQKAEMQAEEAREAFENMSPEEQVALMQQVEAQDQQAEEEAAMQEQAMAEQQMQGQPSEEEMMQQQMMAQQGGMPMQDMMPQDQMGQPAVLSAYGGPVNRFDDGGPKYDWDALIKAITNYKKGKFNLGKYKTIADFENSDEYKAFTKEVLDYINSNPSFTSIKAVEDLRQQMLLRYLNELSGRSGKSFFGKAEDGTYRFMPETAELYKSLREDGRPGMFHLNPSVISEIAEAAASNADAAPVSTSTATAAATPVTYTDAQKDTIRNAVLKTLGVSTVGDLQKWAKDNKVTGFDDYDKIDWGNIRGNKSFMDALAKGNSDLAHAINTGGYDFGLFQPTKDSKGKIQSIDVGNWKTSGSKKGGSVAGLIKGWEGSTDALWKEVKDKIKPDMSLKDVENLMKETEAYKKTTEWLKASPDNMLAYLQAIEDDDRSPDEAKKHYMVDKNGKDRGWVVKGEDGKLKWKDGYTPNYDEIFGTVRGSYPGSYWHTHVDALRTPEEVNWVQREDGSWDKVIGDIGEDWEKVNSYNWFGQGDDNKNYTYNYYRNPAVAKAKADAEKAAKDKKWQDDYDVLPIHRNEDLRYASALKPALGLAMMAAGIGRPDFKGIDAAVEAYNHRGTRLADYKPIGEMISYNPFDIWANQNRMDANARATDRAIANNAGPLGTRNAGLVANSYASQLGTGQLHRDALAYNDQLEQQVAGFNRGTSQTNAEGYNRAALQNAQAVNQDRGFAAELGMRAAQQKMAADAGWYNSLYGNVGGIATAIGDIGKENAQHNMIADMAANGIFGTLTPNSPIATKFLKWQKKDPNAVSYGAEGGKVNRKKNKRRGGLTY